MKQRNDLWSIYYNINNDKRIIVKDFSAKTEKEAKNIYEKIQKDEKFKDFNLILENRNVKWWRIYKKPSTASTRVDPFIKTLMVFKAKTRKEAYECYCDYLKKNNIKDSKLYFYGSAWGHLYINKDETYTDSHSMSYDADLCDKNDLIKEKELIKEYRCGFKAAEDEYKLKYEKEIPYFIKTGHSRNEWFDIGHHVINDLLFNIPILIEKVQGFPTEFTNLAVKKLNLGNKNLDQKEKEKKVSDLAFNMWKDELRSFLENLQLYQYYSNYGVVDPKDKNMVLIDKKYKNTLPIYPGTEEFDYVKLGKMTNDKWNYISNWMKKWLLSCWD